MLVLRLADIHQVIDMREAVAVIEGALAALSRREVTVPVRMHIPAGGENATLIMPAYLQSSQEMGAKIVSVYPSNREKGLPVVIGCIIYLDGITGKPLAIMDGTYLTAVRTGAAGGVACRWLSREDSTAVAVIGAGAQARTQLLAAQAVRPIKQAYIYDRAPAALRGFLDWCARACPELEAAAAASAEDAVRKADIVITATTSTRPVFDHRALKPGTHITGIGSFTPQMQEIPEEVVLRSKVVVDSVEGVLAEAGDLIIPLEKGLITREKIHGEIGEVVLGARKGRENAEEITFFKSVGVAVMDVAIASFVYRKAREKGLGVEIDLEEQYDGGN